MTRTRRMLMWVAIAAAAIVIVGLVLWNSIDINPPPATRPLPPGAKVALAEIDPVAGAEFVTREGSVDVFVACPTGNRAQAIEYDLAGEFSNFTAQARGNGSGGARIEVLVDGDPGNGPGADLRQVADLNIPVEGARKLAFRISCDNPADQVTIGAGTLHRRV